MKDRSKAIIASAVVVLMLAMPVLGVTQAWFSDSGSATIETSTGDVSTELSISYLRDTSEDGATIGEDHQKTPTEIAALTDSKYMFGFKDEASATVSNTTVTLTNMAQNDSIEIGLNGKIYSTVSALYRVAATWTTTTTDSTEIFETVFKVNGVEYSAGSTWVAMDPGTITLTPENTSVTVSLPFSSVETNNATASLSLKLEAYQENAAIPYNDGDSFVIKKKVEAGDQVVLRAGISATLHKNPAVIFKADAAGIYTLKISRMGSTGVIVEGPDGADLSAQKALIEFNILSTRVKDGGLDGLWIRQFDSSNATVATYQNIQVLDEEPSTVLPMSDTSQQCWIVGTMDVSGTEYTTIRFQASNLQNSWNLKTEE